MKRMQGILGLMLVMALPRAAAAATSDTVAVTVTIGCTLSVNVTETTLNLGTVAPSGTIASTSGATVTNNGSGCNETYSLSLTNPSGWTASQTAPGANQYVLNAAMDADGTGITWGAANHALSTTPTACSATKFAGDQTCLNVAGAAGRKLWFQFLAPTSTSVTTQQSITVTVTAQQGT